MREKILVLLDLNKDVENYIVFLKGVVMAFVSFRGDDEELTHNDREDINQKAAKMVEVIESKRELISDKFASLYAENYNESEIEALIEFFNTRAGEKYARRSQHLEEDMNGFSRFVIGEIMDDCERIFVSDDEHLVADINHLPEEEIGE